MILRNMISCCNPPNACCHTVGSSGTDQTRIRGALESSLDQACAPERALSRTNSSSTSVGKSLAEFGIYAGRVNAFEGLVQGDEKSAHLAKKVVKFKANNSPRRQTGDDLHSLQGPLSQRESETGSVQVAPLASGKKGSRRYSVDDCGIAIAHRTELNAVQVKAGSTLVLNTACGDLFVKSNRSNPCLLLLAEVI